MQHVALLVRRTYQIYFYLVWILKRQLLQQKMSFDSELQIRDSVL